MDPKRLDAALEEAFGGTAAQRRPVVRAARDLADAGKPSRDRGHGLTPPGIVQNLEDAPDDVDLVDRWNWWMGALDAAYGGYDQFTVRFLEDDEEADLQR